jgi:isopentenyl-diphosphate delta-isomerase
VEQVVLLDESGRPTGVADKATVHGHRTPLHLAFSCYLFNNNDQLLLTQRALSKKTWPGVWTNSCCGHPAPGEALLDAVARRLHGELGIATAQLTLVLPRFRYRASMDNGITENEMCPVLAARTNAEPRLNPSEVNNARWIDWTELSEGVISDTISVSPWCALQVRQLNTLGTHPDQWPPAPLTDLPPVATHT